MPRPTTLPAPWCHLVARLGSVEALAKALCCSPRTLNRWARRETTPDLRSQDFIRTLFVGFSIQPPEF